MEKKYQIDTVENKKFMNEIRDNLFDFGYRFPSPEGSAYYLGDDGTPWKERNRETWITCRMAHVYSLGTLLGHAVAGDDRDELFKNVPQSENYYIKVPAILEDGGDA